MDNQRQMHGGDSEEEHVMSKVHLGCPPGTSGPHLSRFIISLPSGVESSRYNLLFEYDGVPAMQQVLSFDEDGDLVLPRRSKLPARCCNMTVQHNITSSVPNVGLQVWRAELVLSDFVLHKMCTSSELDGIISLELGAGTGLLGILLARVAQTVFITDHGDEILDNGLKNVSLNSGLFNPRAAVHVRELDWFNPWPANGSPGNPASPKRYSWTSSEIKQVQAASLIFAADVIYSDDLTDALFSILEKLMSLGAEKVLYLALEKRYNFSIDDLDVVANGYSHFRSYINQEGVDNAEGEWHRSLPCFVGKCVDLSEIPQYIKDYNRGNDIELWQIRYKGKKC